MQITKEFLQAEIQKMIDQRNRAHEIAVASQAAIDVMDALIARLEMPESTESKEPENGSV
jgi:hypothetical protein